MKLIKRIVKIVIIGCLVGSWQIHAHGHTVEVGLENSESLYPAEISFCICDAKYQAGKLKILEFGEGNRSRFNGYNALQSEDGGIWKGFWKYLAQFNLPIWYIGPELENQTERQKEICYKEFKNLGGIAVNSIEELKKNHAFLGAAQKKARRDATKIEDYKGILIFRHKHASSKEIIELRKEFPFFIILNRASSFYVNNKYHTANMFDHDALKAFRPRCQAYEKNYYDGLGKDIIKDFNQCELFVIKPINAFKGDGVIMVPAKNLEVVLKHILLKTPNVVYSKNTAFNHWANDNNTHFLIEEYERSRLLEMEEKLYDPTMRMVFTMHFNEGVIHLNFIDGYWKLPAKALNENGTLIEKCKSKIVEDRQSSIKISPQDMHASQELFKDILPLLYIKMLRKRDSAWLEEREKTHQE